MSVLSMPAAAPLAAASNGVVDSVVFQRYEFKYLIAPEFVEPIRRFIAPYCDMDRFAGRERDRFYTITSLYLDTRGYKSYWDKEHDALARLKLRIRTYGEDSDGPVKFEVKRRFNEVRRKSSVEVPRIGWEGLLTSPANGDSWEFSDAERPALDDFLCLVRSMAARPTMLVRYQRQAFRSRLDRYVRISFDRKISYQPAAGYVLPGRARNWRANDDAGSLDESGPRIVLELKFMTKAPLWLVDLVRTFGLMRRGFSKYCTAMNRAMNERRTGSDLALAAPARGIIVRR
ncbi:MAG: polyphosphate polymerase domain-containing protein [Bryobacteraceae bacterium]|nr:polyphosphate polymerase domain-containing protein [Bryobacteraceae bacterium]